MDTQTVLSLCLFFSKGTPKTFNPLVTKTVRQGEEMMPHNKGPDGVNNKKLKTLKPEKTLVNIWGIRSRTTWNNQ